MKLPRAKHDIGFASRIDGTGPDDVWVMSDRKVFHWNGKSWRADNDAPHLHGIQALEPDHAIINDTTTHYRWDGTTWAKVVLSPSTQPPH
jgi:hypothetical protein